MVPHSSP
jgi:Methyltransferase domain